MNIDSTYISKSYRLRILDIYSRETLTRLVDSYSRASKSAIAIYLPREYPPQSETLDWIESEEATDTMLPDICKRYRSYSSICEQQCRNCYLAVSLNYYSGNWQSSKLFRCHLGLWVMSYPLFVCHRLLGVVVGGETIVADKMVKKTNGISEIGKEIEWSPIHMGASESKVDDYKIEDIKNNISHTSAITIGQKRYLTSLLNALRKKPGKHKYTQHSLISKYCEFKYYCSIMQKNISAVGEQYIELNMQRHLQDATDSIIRLGQHKSPDHKSFTRFISNAVSATLPNFVGYVLYWHGLYDKSFQPLYTYIASDRNVKGRASFRKLCRCFFEHIMNDKKTGRPLTLIDLTDTSSPDNLKGLLSDSINMTLSHEGKAIAAAFPMIGPSNTLKGCLVTIMVSEQMGMPWEMQMLESALLPYADCLRRIVDTVKYVLINHDENELKVMAWDARMHELIGAW